MLASEITNLAGLWLGVITRWDLAADEWVEMSSGTSAITIGWYWQVVNVVHYGQSISL